MFLKFFALTQRSQKTYFYGVAFKAFGAGCLWSFWGPSDTHFYLHWVMQKQFQTTLSQSSNMFTESMRKQFQAIHWVSAAICSLSHAEHVTNYTESVQQYFPLFPESCGKSFKLHWVSTAIQSLSHAEKVSNYTESAQQYNHWVTQKTFQTTQSQQSNTITESHRKRFKLHRVSAAICSLSQRRERFKLHWVSTAIQSLSHTKNVSNYTESAQQYVHWVNAGTVSNYTESVLQYVHWVNVEMVK